MPLAEVLTNDKQPVVDPQRRLWLTATSVSGRVGLIATAVPLVSSMAPSERARALGAPVELDLAGIKPGELKTVEWRGKPVFVLHRVGIQAL